MPTPTVILDEGLSAAAAVRLYALHVLKACRGNRPQAAASLDVDPSTLRKWMQDLEKQGASIPAAPARAHRPRKAIAISVPASSLPG